jgi:cytoskeletal protein CcmA (bactofilin family)
MDTQAVTAEQSVVPPRAARYRADVYPGTITLGPRDQLVGKLVYEGDVRVQGTFEGEANLSGDLQVDGGATVKAKLECRNLSVRGSLEGEAAVRDRLLIAGSGVVSGTFRVARLVVEDGALLNGNISMERTAMAPLANGQLPDDSV